MIRDQARLAMQQLLKKKEQEPKQSKNKQKTGRERKNPHPKKPPPLNFLVRLFFFFASYHSLPVGLKVAFLKLSSI